MTVENKVVAKIPSTSLTVEECVSETKGTTYRAVFAIINGVKVCIGFVNIYTENALLKAGVKL